MSNNNLRFITYLPILDPLSMITVSKNKLDKWLRILKLNHPLIFFLPPYKEIIKGLGAFVNYQNIRSMKIADFVKSYKSPKLCLKSPYKDKLNSEISKLFNRVPISHPENDELFKEFLGLIKKK